METQPTSTASAGHLYPGKTSRWPMMCPCCGARATRMERRWSDLLLSLALPVRRYRCVVPRCGWQGRVRSD